MINPDERPMSKANNPSKVGKTLASSIVLLGFLMVHNHQPSRLSTPTRKVLVYSPCKNHLNSISGLKRSSFKLLFACF